METKVEATVEVYVVVKGTPNKYIEKKTRCQDVFVGCCRVSFHNDELEIISREKSRSGELL